MFSNLKLNLLCIAIIGCYFSYFAQPDVEIDDPDPSELFELCLGEDLELSISLSTDSLMIDWGDGAPEFFDDNPEEAVHTYTTSGLYTVLLVSIESPFPNDTATLQVNIIPVDTINFTSDHLQDTCLNSFGTVVNFNDQSILSSSGYRIDYGDGSGEFGVLSTHTYNTIGTYIVTASPLCGGFSQRDTIVIEGTVGLVDSISILSECPCNTIDLRANTSGEVVAWNFGDGTNIITSSNEQTHTYSDPGYYNVSVTVSDIITGCTQTFIRNILICGDDASFYSTRSNDEWHFGGNLLPGVRLRFDPPYINFPIADTNTANDALEGGASVTHPVTGELLFYSDGERIYNSDNAVMENGDDLDGNNSSTQSVLIVPFPGDIDKYYVFVSNGFTGQSLGYSYSIVMMDTLGGLGAVIEKNTPLFTGQPCPVEDFGQGRIVHEAISGTLMQRANCYQQEAYWVIIPTCMGNYSAYPVTINGVGAPVVSTFPFSSSNGNGESVVSPDGTQYAISEGLATKLFDFNKETGELSNERILDLGRFFYNLAFSPDGSKIYGASFSTGSIFQYDLTVEDVNGSVEEFIIPNARIGGIHLGPDNRLYVGVHRNDSLHVFNTPNLKGTAADLQIARVIFPGGLVFLGFQNIVPLQLPIDPDTSNVVVNSSIVDCRTVDFSANLEPNEPCDFFDSNEQDAFTYTWDFGDSTISNDRETTHTYSIGGSFDVRLIVDKPFCPSDTSFLTIAPGFITQNLDTTICGVDSVFIDGFLITSDTMLIDTLQTSLGCDSIISTTVTLTTNDATIASQSPLCADDSPVQLAAADTGGVWSGIGIIDTITGIFDPNVVIVGVDTILISYTISGPCSDTGNLTVLVSSGPEIEALVSNDSCLEEIGNIDLNLIGLSPFLFTWNDGVTQEDRIELGVGNYTVTVQDSLGCSTTEIYSIIDGAINCSSFFVSNSFTPNGDGANDIFRPSGLGIASEDYVLRIYNRWGEVIFETTDFEEGWDGTYQGKLVQEGVYVWNATYREIGGRSSESGALNQETGNVNLIR